MELIEDHFKRLSNVQLSDVGADFPDGMDFTMMCAFGHGICTTLDHGKWWLADWYVEICRRFPKQVQMGFQSMGIDDGVIRSYATATKIPRSHRSAKITFAHHKAIADLAPDAKQLELIKATEDNRWTVPELRRQIAGMESGETRIDMEPVTEFAPGEWASKVVRMSVKWKWDKWEPQRKAGLRKQLLPAYKVLQSLFSDSDT